MTKDELLALQKAACHVRWEGWRDYLETQLFWSRMRWLNRRRWPMRLQEVELVDPYGGGLTTYLRPAEMLRQCQAAGWSKVRAHGIDGRVIAPGAELDATGDPWIYFLCEE